jgi:hypothetical protein
LQEQGSVLRVGQDTAAIQLKKDEARITVELTLLTSCPHSILDWIRDTTYMYKQHIIIKFLVGN